MTYGVDATDGSPDGQDFPFAVAAMPDGGAVVIGKLSIPNTSGDGPKHRDAIVRYNGSGAILWQKALTGTIAELDSQGTLGYGHARVLADSLGNIFVISQLTSTAGGGNSAHPYVARLDQNGNLVWQTNFHSARRIFLRRARSWPADLRLADRAASHSSPYSMGPLAPSNC